MRKRNDKSCKTLEQMMKRKINTYAAITGAGAFLWS